MMTTTRPDLLIAGASFAGLACARAAAGAGLDVVVLERKHDPGDGVRTTGILVPEAAEALVLPSAIVRRISAVRVYGPSMRRVDLAREGYHFLATDTPALLRHFADEARAAGARILTGRPFRRARLVPGGVSASGIEGEARATGAVGFAHGAIEARFLVGADGARSRVARAFSLGANRRFLTGVELELEDVRGLDPDRLHCFVDRVLAPGYLGWIVPGVGVTQIGLAASDGRRLGPRLDGLLAKAGRVCDLSRARVVGRRAGLIPCGGTVRPFASERVMLVGDASGCVSPATAGGIHGALRFGARAGALIAEHLAGGEHPAAALAREMPRYRWKGLLRRALDLGPPDLLADLALATAPGRAIARLMYFHSRGLFSREAWRDLFASY